MPTTIAYYIHYQNLIGLKILILSAVGFQIRPNVAPERVNVREVIKKLMGNYMVIIWSLYVKKETRISM